jgi:predicted HAD superfamily Cof-like phosphohydrolase
MSKEQDLFGFNNVSQVPFVDEVEIFNRTFGKPNNYEPTIPEKKEWQFVYDFILEELEEYKEACETGNIVEILDALCDIAYVSIGNGTMLHGLKDKIWPAYQEVQASNMSKACETEEEAM